MKIPQHMYTSAVLDARQQIGKALKDPNVADACRKARALDPNKWTIDNSLIKAASRALIKAGISTSTGFNFYDLRGPAYFLFPINTPFIQMIGKKGKVNAGVGTAAHWKATRNPNSTNVYVGVQEGQRGPTATPDEVDYFATYKELGMEGGNTFTSQFAGEGYTDNLGDEHFRNLARLRLGEEMMTLLGNSGTGAGNQGIALGRPTAPTIALAGTAPSPGALPDATKITVFVVAISGMGLNPGGQGGYVAPPTVTGGLTPTYTVYGADGSQRTQAGGISSVSATSNSVTTSAVGNELTVTGSTPAVKGAFAYAWYVSANGAPTTANAYLTLITNVPSFTLTTLVGAGTQAANSTGLSVDNSFSTLDFDGLLTYAMRFGRWVDMGGGSLTPQGNGLILEVESDLQYFWENFQVQPDGIWCAADTRLALDQCIAFSATGTNSYIFAYDKATQGAIMGGFFVDSYKSKYSMNPQGGAAIPIRLHPMIPLGTIYYDLANNPYPHSRIPAVREFLAQRDYYSIEWPITTRSWTYGTYVHEVLAHYMPWVSGIRTGVGPFVAP